MKGIKCGQAWDVLQKEYSVFYSYEELSSMGLNRSDKKNTLYAIVTLLDNENSCDVVLQFSALYKDKKINNKFESEMLDKISKARR